MQKCQVLFVLFLLATVSSASALAKSLNTSVDKSQTYWIDNGRNIEWALLGRGTYQEAREACHSHGSEWNFPERLTDRVRRSMMDFLIASPVSNQIDDSCTEFVYRFSGYRPCRMAWSEDAEMTAGAYRIVAICPYHICPAWLHEARQEGSLKTTYHLYHDENGNAHLANDSFVREDFVYSMVCFRFI